MARKKTRGDFPVSSGNDLVAVIERLECLLGQFVVGSRPRVMLKNKNGYSLLSGIQLVNFKDGTAQVVLTGYDQEIN